MALSLSEAVPPGNCCLTVRDEPGVDADARAVVELLLCKLRNGTACRKAVRNDATTIPAHVRKELYPAADHIIPAATPLGAYAADLPVLLGDRVFGKLPVARVDEEDRLGVDGRRGDEDRSCRSVKPRGRRQHMPLGVKHKNAGQDEARVQGTSVRSWPRNGVGMVAWLNVPRDPCAPLLGHGDNLRLVLVLAWDNAGCVSCCTHGSLQA